DWHVAHLESPQSVVPESIMPKYGFLLDTLIEPEHVADLMKTHVTVGVPYTAEMIENAEADFRAQADPEWDYDQTDALIARYPNANARNFDGAPGISEMDALVSYLQVLGTMVDFSTFTPDASR
ncbi:MAG: cbb3-type cytochrome c oxidase subunit II, partial [Mangrovicoccus sp.]